MKTLLKAETKMHITGQLDEEGSRMFTKRMTLAYIIAAVGVSLGGLAALIHAVRWW